MQQDETATMVDAPIIGALTYREWHEFVNGLYAGARWGFHDVGNDHQHEYWRAAYLCGTLLRYVLLVALIKSLRCE